MKRIHSQVQPFLLSLLFLTIAISACSSGGGAAGAAAGETCSEDTDCAEGLTCQTGVCAEPISNSCDNPQCITDLDCPAGQQCNNLCLCVPSGTVDGDSNSDGDNSDGDLTDGDGDPSDPKIITPDELDFGAVSIGGVGERELVIANGGEASLEVFSIEIENSTTDEFSVVAPLEETLFLGPDESYTAIIRYLPVDPGIDEGTLKVITNDPSSRSVNVRLISQYKGDQDIDVQPENIAFPDTNVGQQTSPQCVNINNHPAGEDTNKVLNITRIRIGSGSQVNFEILEHPPLPVVLSPVQSQQICIVYHPASEGEQEDELIIENDDPDLEEQEFSVPIYGRGVQPHIEIRPNPIDFNRVYVGRTVPLNVVIENIGGGRLTVSRIAIEEGDEDAFTTSHDSISGPWVIETGEQLSITINFTPDEARAFSSKLVVESDDPDNLTMYVNILGMGAYSQLTLEPARLDYPVTRLGFSSHLSVVFRNAGQIPIVINGLNYDGATVFQAIENPFPLELPVGGARELTFAFTPELEEVYDINARIQTDDPSQDYSLPFHGIGGLPHLELDPSGDVDMGDVQIDEAKAQIVTIENIGDFPMQVTSLAMTPGSSRAFSLDADSTTYSVPGNDSITVRIVAAPTDQTGTGTMTGALSFLTDDSDNRNVVVNLSARAINPRLLVSPATNYDFGSIQGLTQSDPVNFQLANSGIGNLVIDRIQLSSGEGVFVLNGVPGEEAFPLTLGEGDTLTFTITFAPPGFSPYSGSVSVETNIVTQPIHAITLSGIGSGCEPGFHECEDVCYADTDLTHCGATCVDCSTGLADNDSVVCQNAICQYSCNEGWDDCNDDIGTNGDGCESDVSSDAGHCGACDISCFDNHVVNASCNDGMCAVIQCEENWENLNNDGSDGCECQSSGEDQYGDGIDSNCDGVDGEADKIIYVAESASGDGSIDSPMGSLQDALAAAGYNWQIWVAEGEYYGKLSVADGKHIIGGFRYDGSGGWRRASGAIVRVVNNIPEGTDSRIIGLYAYNVISPTFIENIVISVGDNDYDSGSVYGIWMKNCSDLFVLKNVVINTGRGGPGANGDSGVRGENGKEGKQGAAGTENSGGVFCSGESAQPVVGAGAGSDCGAIGGNGGAPGDGDGHDGKKGGDGWGGTSGGSVGSAPDCGTFGNSCSGCSNCLSSNGGIGSKGSDATQEGDPGFAGNGNGQVTGDYWLPTNAGDGDRGAHGHGGGGGGGGGGGCNSCDSWGSAGSGGGSGGCGGYGGKAGGGGGGSFGVFAIDSFTTLNGCIVTAGEGGRGGRGGSGGQPGDGGDGGDPPPYGGSGGQDDGGCGGAGGNGGRGAMGGPGGGGGGGPSYGAYLIGASELTTISTTFSALGGGIGGLSNGNIGETGPSGPMN